MCQALAVCGLMGFTPNGSGPCPISTISATLQQLSASPCHPGPAAGHVCLGCDVPQNLVSWTIFFKQKPNFSAENPAVAGGFT